MSHPYIEYENSELWRIVESSVNDLVDNGDIELTTNLEYVVGYLCKQLSASKALLAD